MIHTNVWNSLIQWISPGVTLVLIKCCNKTCVLIVLKAEVKSTNTILTWASVVTDVQLYQLKAVLHLLSFQPLCGLNANCIGSTWSIIADVRCLLTTRYVNSVTCQSVTIQRWDGEEELQSYTALCSSFLSKWPQRPVCVRRPIKCRF